MKTRYKVVKKRNRYSAIVNGNCKYALKYLPGTIVESVEGTMGIFVFKHKTYAENWCSDLNSRYWTDDKYMVIEVEPLVKGSLTVMACGGVTADKLDRYYNTSPDSFNYPNISEIPDDTYCHKAVRVLT